MVRVQLGFMALALLLCACRPPESYDVLVEGSIHGERGPAASLPLRFALGDTESPPCTGDIRMESGTDAQGRFMLVTRYQPRVSEAYSVRTYRHSLCTLTREGWTPLWTLRTGPARERTHLRCRLDPATHCDLEVRPGIWEAPEDWPAR